MKFNVCQHPVDQFPQRETGLDAGGEGDDSTEYTHCMIRLDETFGPVLRNDKMRMSYTINRSSSPTAKA
jgi:hypothetical protein